ncbi:hypothetical protein [Iamia sp.]|uniref:hypothetical protein n=1 Tax=Iamia sp. TaxID=2722710 RepID=UPI002C0357F7|nr:hypothetical protein [Iamia sp.]HXH57965.1 hypothetical protein [Iamia sp.]
MGWRDGCAPRPAVDEGAGPVRFDFGGADVMGRRLDGLRRTVEEDLAARTAATIHLVDWAGGHRQAFDDHRGTQEGVLSGAELEAEIARLRAAWDDAAAAQHRANRDAADAADAPSGVPVPR